MTIINHAEVLAAYGRRNRQGGQAGHYHLWIRDDRPGWREYVCICCAYTFGVRPLVRPYMTLWQE